ncbi:MAG: hypothetical protein WBN94_01745 [Methanothrix sp.]
MVKGRRNKVLKLNPAKEDHSLQWMNRTWRPFSVSWPTGTREGARMRTRVRSPAQARVARWARLDGLPARMN